MIDIERAAVELAQRTRSEQGLPPKITDPVVLHRIAVLLREVEAPHEP